MYSNERKKAATMMKAAAVSNYFKNILCACIEQVVHTTVYTYFKAYAYQKVCNG